MQNNVSVMKWSARALLGSAIVVGLVGCGGKTTPAATITGITLTPATASINVGAETKLTATVQGTGTFDKTFTITTSNASVATVDNTGLVKGITPGTADITVKTKGTGAAVKTAMSMITVTAVDTGPVTPPGTAGSLANPVKINFQPVNDANNTAIPVPAGYTADNGLGFNGTSGWVVPGTSDPVSVAGGTRFRGASSNAPAGNVLQRTLAHMQLGTKSPGVNVPNGSWQYKVPNGRYTVIVSAGDGDKSTVNGVPVFDSIHQINVEGVAAVKAFQPTDAKVFDVETVTVDVADGLLTLDATGGDNTKINYVNIDNAAADAPLTPIATPTSLK